ncbi:MAG TPA: hypothetical protein VIC71_10355 [Gammaproteobacteria bacterium]
MFDDLRDHLAGKGRLSRAYWGYGAVGTAILMVVVVIGAFFLLPFVVDEADILSSPVILGYAIGAYLVLVAYQVFVGVLIWRNAMNVDNPTWGHVARVSVVLGALGIVYEIVREIQSLP